MTATVPFRANSDLLDAQYNDWKKDPRSVDATWASFFEGFELGLTELTNKNLETGDIAYEAIPGQKQP